MNSNSPPPSSVYYFAEFRIDVTDDALWRGDERLSINRRTFGVLRLLVERAGEIISKQEFFETVWADTFVEDNSLTVAMTALRKVLGDDAKNPVFIENLPRKGYRFIAEVRVVDAGIIHSEIAKPKLAEGPLERRRISGGVVAACLLILTLCVGLSYTYLPQFSLLSAKKDQIESIAVLPFENADAESEYLSDGLTDNVINDLTKLPNLRIISRNSVFQYKNKQTDVQRIGRELDVRGILTGRFVQTGDTLVINTELTDLKTNSQIWGKQYVRKAADAFTLQNEITRDVSEAFRSDLTNDQRQRLAQRRTDNPEAFQLYLKGRYQWNKRTGESHDRAVEYYKQAIEKDPAYAMPYVGLADCYSLMGFRVPVTLEERVAMIKGAAQRALEIDPDLGEVYATLAINSHFNEWNWALAEQQYKTSLQLSPSYATAHHWYAEFLATEGRFDESFAEYKEALRLDPLSLAIKTDEGLSYYYAHQPDQAIEHLKRIEELDPGYVRTPIFLSDVYEEKGMMLEAIAEHEKDKERTVGNWETKKPALVSGFQAEGPRGYWKALLRTTMQDEDPDLWWLAKCHIRLGENDKAFEILEKMVQLRVGPLAWMKVSPAYDGIRGDPRFDTLMRRVGLPQ